MTPTDITQWTLSEWLGRLPASVIWSGIAMIAGIFGAGFGLSTWLEKRARSFLQDQIESLRAAPKTSINIGSEPSSLGNVSGIFRFSLEKPDFIHPKILDELEGWISDALPVFAAVDLEGSVRSNRFFRKVETRHSEEDQKTWVYAIKEDQAALRTHPFYAYKFIGTTRSGTQIVQTANSGGGSGIFASLLFLQLQTDEVVDQDLARIKSRHRVLLKCVGRHALGDRYDGVVTFSDGVLTIGKGHRIDIGLTAVDEIQIRVDD